MTMMVVREIARRLRNAGVLRLDLRDRQRSAASTCLLLTTVDSRVPALSLRRTLFELLCESKMNVSSLEVPPFQQVQRVSAEASDKDADVRFHCRSFAVLLTSDFINHRSSYPYDS